LVEDCGKLFNLIGSRAENLFETHQLLCSEAVLFVLNEGLRGGLAAEFAIRLASGFGDGIGKTGCMCGAFAGALMGLGRDNLLQDPNKEKQQSSESHV
jgi:C_GCAxxG_C_C family probable redox protein